MWIAESTSKSGPEFGYYPNAPKTWFIVKQEHFALANEIFANLGVQIIVDGRRHLRAVLGTSSFAETYVRDKVQGWVGEVTRLSSNASSQLQAAYAALTRGLYT